MTIDPTAKCEITVRLPDPKGYFTRVLAAPGSEGIRCSEDFNAARPIRVFHEAGIFLANPTYVATIDVRPATDVSDNTVPEPKP